MDRLFFRSLIQNKPLILDGATGTYLQANGLSPGDCPTSWVLAHPDVLARLQTDYYESGSDVVLAFSFGANRYKLDPVLFVSESIADINARVAAISIDVRNQCQIILGRPLYVAGDLSPTGQFLYPAGDLSQADLISVYGEQVDGLLKAGVDLFVVETMLDLAQTRAAVIAVRERCNLPVVASLTVNENGRSLSGDLPLACLLSLQAVGADAFGFNCSFGPERLAAIIIPLLSKTQIPLMVKPNAGMPRLAAGVTVFPLDPTDFAIAMKPLAVAGVRLLGGCCGTGPAHIRQLTATIANTPSGSLHLQPPGRMICSSRSVLSLDYIGQLKPIRVIDPASLMDQVFEAQEDEPEGLLLDCSELDPALWNIFLTVLAEIAVSVPLPLAFSAQDDLIELILRQYPGRAAIIGSYVSDRIDALNI